MFESEFQIGNIGVLAGRPKKEYPVNTVKLRQEETN